MKTKTFDCVEMKRHGAARLRAQTKNMTLDEEVSFWKERTQALRARRRTLREKRAKR